MTVAMMGFVALVIIWLCIGLVGVLRCLENRINYEMIFFILFVYALLFIAKFWKLL